MAIPTTIESLSATAASNGPAGSEQRTLADDGLRQAYAFVAQVVNSGSNIASATTITPPSTGSSFHITGTTAITTIASTNSWNGRLIVLIFDGILTFTHSSNLALPGSANITTAANDVAFMRQDSSGAWRCVNYQRATAAIEGSTGTFSGAVTGSTFNGNTFTTGTGVLTIAAAKTLTASNTLTLAGTDGKTLTVSKNLTLDGTDGTSMTFPATSTIFNYGKGAVTATAIANCGIGAAYMWWNRWQDQVFFTGYVTVNPTATGTGTTLDIDLPIASAFTSADQAAGTAVRDSVGVGSAQYISASIEANATNDRLRMTFVCDADAATYIWRFHGAYTIL